MRQQTPWLASLPPFNPNGGCADDNDLATRWENGRRAELADSILAFAQRSGKYCNGDDPTDLQDLLSDLMHFCHRERVDFEDVLETARHRFLEEASPEAGSASGTRAWRGFFVTPPPHAASDQ